MRDKPTVVYRMLRAQGIDSNPQTYIKRAAAFATSATSNGTAILLLVRDENGLSARVIVSERAARGNAQMQLANAVGARAEHDREFDVSSLSVPVVGWLDAEDGVPFTRETPQGQDPAEVSRLLSNSMPVGSWVAVLIRRPAKSELRAHRAWLAHRTGSPSPTHHSLSPHAVVCSIVGGGDDESSVEALLQQAATALPGFDTPARPVMCTPRSMLMQLVGPSVVAFVLAGASLFAAPVLGGWIHSAGVFDASLDFITRVFSAFLPTLLVIAGTTLLLVGVLRMLGVLKPWGGKLLAAARGARPFPAPPARLSPPRPPRQSRQQMVDGQMKFIEARPGDYPLSRHGFLVSPDVVTGVVAPQAGALSGDMATGSRPVPPRLLQPIGPSIGSSNGQLVHLSAHDMMRGIAITGAPGSGKTALVNGLWAWATCERAQPSNRPNYPGTRHTLITFDSKGDEVAAYQEWGQVIGDQVTVVDLDDVSSMGVEMFTGSTPSERASSFVNAMTYAWPDGAIQSRSTEVLTAVFSAACVITPDDVQRANDKEGVSMKIDPLSSPVELAHILNGGHGDDAAIRLFESLNARAIDAQATSADDPVSLDLIAAARMCAPFFVGVSQSARRSTMESSRNKTAELVKLRNWWAPQRARKSWDQLLAEHRNIVVNFGRSSTGVVVNESLGGTISAMLMFLLQASVKRTCSGWAARNRWVSIHSDELAIQAGYSDEVLRWFYDQGRSYGVRLVLATQRPSQLPDKVREVFLTMSTLITYKQDEIGTAEKVAAQLGTTTGEWSASEVVTLPRFSAIIRTGIDDVRQPAFMAAILNFEGDMAGTVQGWGYVPRSGAPVHAATGVPRGQATPTEPDGFDPEAPTSRTNRTSPAPAVVMVEDAWGDSVPDVPAVSDGSGHLVVADRVEPPPVDPSWAAADMDALTMPLDAYPTAQPAGPAGSSDDWWSQGQPSNNAWSD